MSRVEECFIAIRKAFSSEEFSDEEIRQFVNDFEQIKETAGLTGFHEKANEYRKQMELREAAQLKRKQRTLMATRDLKNAVSQDLTEGNKGRMLYQRAQNIFVGGAEVSQGSNFSVQNIRQSYARKMRGALEMTIKAEGMEKLVQDAEFSRNLRTEMSAPGTVQNPSIQRIAKQMSGIYEYQRSELTRLGVDMGDVENYIGWQSYDKAKVIALGEEGFTNLIMNKLDHSKTFRSEITPDQKAKRIKEAYNSIVMGESTDPTKIRSLHYLNGESVHDVLESIGRYPSAVESMLAQIDYTSRRLALMQKFGPNFKDGFESFKSWVEKVSPGPQKVEPTLVDGKRPTGLEGMKARAKELGTTLENMPEEIARRAVSIDNLYLDTIGHTTSPTGTLLASTGATYRTLISLQNLGGAALSALFPDFASNAALIKSFDGKRGIGSTISDIFGQYKSTLFNRQERAETMAMMGIYADDMIGGITNVFGELNEGSQPGLISEAARGMFKWTGLTDHTQNIRAATAKILGARLATHSDRVFSELPEQLRYNLKRYSIGEKEWAIISQAKHEFPNGLVALAPEKIWQLPKGMFDAKMTQGEVYLKFATAMNETTELGTLTGDAYTRTLFYQGMKDDSLWGQMGRFVAQFKQAPIQNIRLVSRIANSSPDIVRRFGAVGKYTGDMASVIPAFAYMTSMGLMSYYAKELAAGKTPPDPTSKATLKEALVRGGGAGLMGDYIFAEYNKSYRNFTTDLAGPAFGNADKVMKLFASSVRGEFKENKFEALRFAVRQLPGNNIWWAKGAFEHLLLDGVQEYMSPGYTLKMDQRLKKQGQQRILPSVGVPNRNVLIGGE